MTDKFFALAVAAALNPKLLAVDLLLIKNRRPVAMFVCLLFGGMAVALAVGLVDVLVVHPDAIKAQNKPSAGIDLALGLLLLAVGGLVATGRPHRRRRAPAPAEDAPPKKKDNWAQRVLAEPRLGLAVVIGVLIGSPGASYLAALHLLATGKSSTATQVVAVVIFVVIEFALLIIPFVFLVFRPEATTALLKRAQDWLVGHERQLIAAIALLLGTYLTVSALVRLT